MRGYVDTSVGQVHYRREGAAGPHVVLLHCANFSSALYARALPILGEHVRAWAFDAPGVGLSDGPATPSHTELASYLLEALDALGITEPTLGGLHTGARLALEMTRQRGAVGVPALVLSGMGPVTPAIETALNAPHLLLTPDADGSEWDKARERYYGLFPTQNPPTEKEGWLQHLYLTASMDKLVPNRVPWPGPSPEGYELRSVFESYPNPILLLNTDEDCFSSVDHDAVEWNPNATLDMVEGSGSHVMLRDPEIYAEHLLAFLRTHGILT
jgi:haloalkane dehalogenase